MLETLVLLALLTKSVPACSTCGLGWLDSPFSAFGVTGQVTSEGGEFTIKTTSAESGWLVRDVLVVAFLVGALFLSVFGRRGRV